MKVAMIAFTKRGGQLITELSEGLRSKDYVVEGFLIDKYILNTSLSPFQKLGELTEKLFKTVDGIIFIGACGIAVRAIAPFICNKTVDPAVVVLDEAGTFAISLLSGHIGGANELTKCVAEMIHAIPVITTATDVNSKLAVDNWAIKNDLFISDITMVKLISSNILNEGKTGIYSEIPIEGNLPPELTYGEVEIGICISKDIHKKPFPKTLNLIPRNIVLGIGCKKETSFLKIEEFVEETLEKYHINTNSIGKICSIDLKSKELGICKLADKYKVKFVTFSAEELETAKGEFASSMFVKNTVGVDNVCERSAVLGSEQGKIVIPKTACNGITLAVCELESKLLIF